MPELAEVEYRRQWDAGLRAKVLAVELHARKRIFRGSNTREIVRSLTGAQMSESIARGKQMLFRFSGGNWLGLHLGMSGTLRIEAPDVRPGKHDHLVLRQAKRALILRDPRLFGRVRFHHGKEDPPWWSGAPDISSDAFSARYVADFLKRHSRAPIKAVLLLQTGFPGIGNWMADEILWRARIAPSARGAALAPPQCKALRRATRFVSSEAMRIIGHDYSDPPQELANSSALESEWSLPARSGTAFARNRWRSDHRMVREVPASLIAKRRKVAAPTPRAPRPYGNRSYRI
ncbi:MAG: Fpg/Nei family DNA glycosylase [Verrucomicrobiota bacterium]|nr:Fpg/Nei family DNA glycosylase [Verrucomicrobiota bacterium]